jgi:hypothetical protein
MLELPELQQQQIQQIQQQQSMPKASLIIDGGHLQHAMKNATIAFLSSDYAQRRNIHRHDIQVNAIKLIATLGNALGFDFDRQYFLQGNRAETPNDFHKMLSLHSINVRILGMKQISETQFVAPIVEPIVPPSTLPTYAVNTVAVASVAVCAYQVIQSDQLLTSVLTILMIGFVIINTLIHNFWVVSFVVPVVPPFVSPQPVERWVERGVDVAIGCQMVDCANGLSDERSGAVVVITGDSDLKPAFDLANDACDVMVISTKSGFAPCLRQYSPKHISINFERLLELSITYKDGTPVDETPPNPNPTNPKPTTPNPTNPTNPIQTTHKAKACDPEFHEIALKLHKFIACDWKGEPFPSARMIQFYNVRDHKDHKIYITKYKIKTICQYFPELIITEVDKTNPAIVTFTLSTSDESKRLINTY